MTVGRNGAVAGPFKLGDLTPARKEVTFERAGEAVTVRAYAAGDNRLSSVVAEIQAAGDRWQAAIGTEASIPAYFQYRRDVLAAIFPTGLQADELDAIAGDDEKYHGLMVYLGWETPKEEETEDPEARGEGSPSTGADSSPSSAPPTTSDTSSS